MKAMTTTTTSKNFELFFVLNVRNLVFSRCATRSSYYTWHGTFLRDSGGMCGFLGGFGGRGAPVPCDPRVSVRELDAGEFHTLVLFSGGVRYEG